jgi:hypothetical protein
MFWSKKSRAEKIADELISLAWETDIGEKEESVVLSHGIEITHYSGVVAAMNIFAVEYGFILESFESCLSDDEVKEIGKIFWEGIVRKCKLTPNPAGAYQFIASTCDAFREAQNMDEKNSAEGLLSLEVAHLFGRCIVEHPNLAPAELTMFAPQRMHSTIKRASKAVAKFA